MLSAQWAGGPSTTKQTVVAVLPPMLSVANRLARSTW